MSALELLAASVKRNKAHIIDLCRKADPGAPALETIAGWERNIEAARQERQELVDCLRTIPKTLIAAIEAHVNACLMQRDTPDTEATLRWNDRVNAVLAKHKE